MQFKEFLSEAEHPFQQWHKNYLDAVKLEPRRGGWSLFPQPKQQPLPANYISPDQLLKHPDAKINMVQVLELEGSTSGHHGYGDIEEMPASDPYKIAQTEIFIDPSVEKQLRGHHAFIVDRGWGSYHERTVRLLVYVILNPNEEIGNYERFDGGFGLAKGIRHFFIFQSVKQAMKELKKIQPNVTYRPKEGETGQEYWQRILQSRPAPSDDPYNSRDDYYKK